MQAYGKSLPMEIPIATNEPGPIAVVDVGGVRIPVVSWGLGWLVADKPSGMSIHNDPGADLCSLLLAAGRAGRLPGVGRELSALHAVHRIDRDTSGIVLLAADSNMLAFFGGQFAAKTVGKRYLALVHGRADEPSANPRWNEWNWPLTVGAAGRADPMGRSRRKPSTTRWQMLGCSPHYSIVACEPISGRTHQIRRHAKLAGHPVVGDRRYGSTRALAYLSRCHRFNRLGLHAHELTICLPGEAKPEIFVSGGLPEAMRRLIETDQVSSHSPGTPN